MFKSFFDSLKFIFKKITKLTIPYFSLEENDLKFKITSDSFYRYTLHNIDIKTRYDSYIYEAYTLKANNIFLEYIHTYNDVVWNVQAFSAFLSLLKDTLKCDSFERVENKTYSKYEFSVYKVNDEFYLHFIYISEIEKETFIIDMQGELYESLLKNFDKKYSYKFKKSENLNLNINISLVKNNAINEYFKLASS